MPEDEHERSKRFFGALNAAELIFDEETNLPKLDLDDAKKLRAILFDPTMLKGLRAAMNEVEVTRLSIAEQLPTPGAVLEIAHAQGRVKGAYALLDKLISLTMEKPDGNRTDTA